MIDATVHSSRYGTLEVYVSKDLGLRKFRSIKVANGNSFSLESAVIINFE